jgi:hypothetical protein
LFYNSRDVAAKDRGKETFVDLYNLTTNLKCLSTTVLAFCKISFVFLIIRDYFKHNPNYFYISSTIQMIIFGIGKSIPALFNKKKKCKPQM